MGTAGVAMLGTQNPYAYAIGALFLWGLWGVLVNYSLNHMSEWTVLLITYLVAVGVILVLEPRVIDGIPPRVGLVLAIGAGVTMCLGAIFYYRAVNLGKLSIVPAIPALYFVVTAAWGIFVLDESVSLTQIAGIVLACVAIFLMTR